MKWAESHGVEHTWWRRFVVVTAAWLTIVGLPIPAEALLPKGPVLEAPRHHEEVTHPEFRWTAVPGAEEYTLQIAQDRRFANKGFIFTTSSTRFTPTTALPAASYWWRVKVTKPFRSSWSTRHVFTRRWGSRSAGGVARPDNVTVVDYSSEPGIQAPMNALQFSWDPVIDASYYVVQLDHVPDADLDQVPPYNSYFEPPDAVCITSHTVVTPNTVSADLPEQGVALIQDSFDQDCQVSSPGTWFMRVRAVDVTTDARELFSLWSDEAREPDQKAPGPLKFTVGQRLTEDLARTPAVLTSPENGSKYTDAPVLQWNPISIVGAVKPETEVTEPVYKVVIALDRDFTTEVGHFLTTNTRFIPLERIPEDSAERAYYWYVVPCDETGYCISSNQVVNRPNVYRTFTKLSPRPELGRADKHYGAFAAFHWKSQARTVGRYARAGASVGGINYYEFQYRLPRNPWPEDNDVQITDVPELIPEMLSFNTPYQWRVRVVDGSGQKRPWSLKSDVTTVNAAPFSPRDLRAERRNGRVVLHWSKPRLHYFEVTSYTILFSFNGKRWKSLGSTGGLSAAYKVSNNARYMFAVCANSRGGTSRPSRVAVHK